jgi:hypothetical protein
MASAGGARSISKAATYVPLSVFFLQIADQEGEETDSNDGSPRTVTGYIRKGQKKKDNRPLGNINFSDDTKAQTRALKSPIKPKPATESAPGAPVKAGATHATIGATGSGNIPAVVRPIGKPIRRMSDKDRKGWMDRLAKQAK